MVCDFRTFLLTLEKSYNREGIGASRKSLDHDLSLRSNSQHPVAPQEDWQQRIELRLAPHEALCDLDGAIKHGDLDRASQRDGTLWKTPSICINVPVFGSHHPSSRVAS